LPVSRHQRVRKLADCLRCSIACGVCVDGPFDRFTAGIACHRQIERPAFEPRIVRGEKCDCAVGPKQVPGEQRDAALPLNGFGRHARLRFAK